MDPYLFFLERYGSFTDIQNSSFKIVERGSNCIISAPTGSGKTEAVFLPILKRAAGREGIFALYVTPLRALNRDLMARLSGIAAASGVRMAVRHGDTGTAERKKQAEYPPQILVITPETLQNLFLSKRLRSALMEVEAVVVDEVHELYHNKRGAQLAVALERLEELSPGFQRIGISATIGNLEEVCRFIFGKRSHEVISSAKEKVFAIKIEMPVSANDRFGIRELFGLDSGAAARIYRVAGIIKESEAVVVFANTRQVVESLGRKLLYLERKAGFGPLGVHHGSIEKGERIFTEQGFKEGRLKAIVSTSSLELGMDIGKVDYVVQYGSPRQATRLIQRIGRGGHRERQVSRGSIIVSGDMEILESAAVLESSLKGRFEANGIEENAYDVLLNQMCGIALEYGGISSDRLFGIISRAENYRKLGREKFDALSAFAESIGLLGVRDGVVRAGRRSRAYFYKNISVIPEVSRFAVKDVITNKVISYLDEKFVYSNIDEGTYFISKGMPWRVISIEDGVVSVEAGERVEAAVPDWEGEDIPVSRETALAVFGYISAGLGEAAAFVDDEARNSVEEFRSGQRKFFLPGPDRAVIEEFEDYAIVFAPLGKKGNEFLARLLSYVCSYASGGKVGAKATPYAILLDFGYNYRRPDLKKALLEISGIKDFESLDFIRGSDLFRYRFVKVATLFGIIDKGAKIGRGAVDRVMNFYEGGIVAEEVVRDLGKNYFDISAVREFANGIKSGRIRIEALGGAGSPLAMETVSSAYSYAELLSPDFGREDVVEKLKERLGSSVTLLCTFCSYAFSERVDFEEDRKLACPRCKSTMAVVYGDDKAGIVNRAISGKRMGRKESLAHTQIVREAGLISEYGNRAVIALSVYGIGVETAARVLRKVRKEYKAFFVDVLDEQRRFVRNRRFWGN